MKGQAYECIQGRFRNRGTGSSEANQIPNADVRMQPDRWQEYNSLWSHWVTNLIIGTLEWFRIWYRVDEYSMEAMWIVIWISEYQVWCRIIKSEYLDVMLEWWLVTATQKQCTVALSSTEAEYMVLTETSKHMQMTVSLLQQLSFDLDLPIDVFTDSEGAQAIAANNVYHKRTKHIDVKYHYIREKIMDDTVCISKVGSKSNLADVFTKPISRDQHWILTSRIGLVDNPIEGDCWEG